MRTLIRDLIGTLVVAFIVFLLLRLALGNYAVANENMKPEMEVGERLLINKLAYNFREPDRGDVVFYKTGDGGGELLERVIGLPGDVIEIKNGVIHINGIKLNEPYTRDTSRNTVLPFQVPAGNYFVLGDNRINVNDSFTDGMVPRESIQGQAWICAWPPDRWGIVDNYSLDSQLASAAEAP